MPTSNHRCKYEHGERASLYQTVRGFERSVMLTFQTEMLDTTRIKCIKRTTELIVASMSAQHTYALMASAQGTLSKHSKETPPTILPFCKVAAK